MEDKKQTFVSGHAQQIFFFGFCCCSAGDAAAVSGAVICQSHAGERRRRRKGEKGKRERESLFVRENKSESETSHFSYFGERWPCSTI